jgi:cytoskeletal protein CcmA (bactofilin family)
MVKLETSAERVQPSPSTEPGSPERRVVAWIGKAVRVEGKVISAGDLTIDGDVEGSIELGNHDLTIGVGAAIKADLAAKTIAISGAVTGNVRASDKVDLHATGSVDGDISAPRFVMAEGAIVIGKVEAGIKNTPPSQ